MTKFTVVPQDPTPNYEEQSVSRLMSPPNAADSPHTSHWDPNSFIYPATDDRGAFEKVDVRMTPELRHQMLAIVAAQRFPYMSEKDYMRHALVRHAQWLHTLDHTIPYYLPSIEVIAQIERERVKREQFIESIKVTIRGVSWYVKESVFTEARKYYGKVLVEVDRIRVECDEPYWGSKYREMLLGNYRWLSGSHKEVSIYRD